METENRAGVVDLKKNKTNEKRDILVLELRMVYDDVTGQD